LFSPERAAQSKYSNCGNFITDVFNNWNIKPELSKILSDRANKGLAQNTWKQYRCVFNHIKKCETLMGIPMDLPFDMEKTLTFIGYLIDERNCSAKTIHCYLSAVRMAHLTQGIDCPHLRQPIVDLIIKGQAHHETLAENLKRKASRLPVTIPVLRYIKHKLRKINWPLDRKYKVWGAACLLWNGGMRVHEGLSREKYTFDPMTTLLLEDINFQKVTVNRKPEELLKVKLKCPKESSVGNGVVLEIFKNETFFCAISALKKYQKVCPIKLTKGKPLFRNADGSNYTGRELNTDLAELTKPITEGTTGMIRSHSFRSGLATEMGLSGFSDSEIMATGRWSSNCFNVYCKLPRSKRLNFQHKLVKSFKSYHKF
jgi:hypothetical protein